VTPNDFVHGKGRGFLFVADGTDLVRAVSAAKALRTYASSSSFAAGVVGNGPGGVSITLLTDAFGVRSFLPPQPGAKAFQAHLNTNKNKEGGHNHDPTHREENEKSQRRRRQHQRKGSFLCVVKSRYNEKAKLLFCLLAVSHMPSFGNAAPI